ncbi:hypothetical protein [Bacillus toyonensis]|uniref:hypothetical protein n=1 Tax=Bacillus toyonensis TaxID=155322 RepID=UPI000BFD73C1|nr:hypothetical protein [Bacillus toyonensis]MEC2350873.1 hypothetical protein [Bacillus toyonensis]MED3189519.1 hypothetical protein [Bacillus toyonensis]PHA83673.1 hypothetical protein COE77_23545 [Bacillus toyonensis]
MILGFFLHKKIGSGAKNFAIQQTIDFALKVNSLLGKEHAKVEIFFDAIHSSMRFETKKY